MEIVVMPKLGFNMDQGKLVQWYKKEGDRVSKGEAVFSIETDKTSIDVEATQDGVMRKLLAAEGESIPVTLPIAIIAGENDDISDAVAEALALLGGLGAPQSAPDAMTGGAGTASTFASKTGLGETASAMAPNGSDNAMAPNASDNAMAPNDADDAPAPKTKRDYDLIVIGGGPGGYVAAIRAAKLGLKTAIAEKEQFGGVCLNRGCIPTKTFLRSLEILNELRDAADFGVSGIDAGNAGLDMKKVQARKKKITSELVVGVNALLKKNKVDILTGEAHIQDRYTVTIGAKIHTTEHIIIATGSEVKSLPDGIIERKEILTSDTVLNLERIPDEITVIGGGVIGVEFAYFFAGAGAKVTIVEFLDRILPTIDEEIADMAADNLRKAGIAIYTGAKVTKITEEAVEFEKDGKMEKVSAVNVLMAVGRAPRLGADIEKLGIRTEKGAIVTDERMRTSAPNIYAVGDVNGKHMLAHAASAEGIVAVENIAGKDAVIEYGAVPGAIYINPEIASVGMSEAEARARRSDIRVGRFPIAANGKSKVEGDARGLVKVIIDGEYGEILGVHLYCQRATDMIAEAVAAINAEATADEMVRAIHPHPTVSEAIQEAFHAALGGAIHF
jgi:dihydrolipoamide dehydrogenase